MKNLRDLIIKTSSAFLKIDWPLTKVSKLVIKYILGIAYPFWSVRINELPGMLKMTFKYLISSNVSKRSFPDVKKALCKPDGLLLVGGKIEPQRLMEAYRNGIYPHRHIGPVKWYAPKERMVLFPENTHISKGIRKLIRRKIYRISFDRAFRDVIEACAEPRAGKTPLTWINKDVIQTFCSLYEKGFAHSVETWNENDELVGGLFGVAIGKIFFSESMFFKHSNTSKLASAYLNCHLYFWNYALIDLKRYTKLAQDEGAYLIPRGQFTDLINNWCDHPEHGNAWRVDDTINVSDWRPK
jgi:leucyl/phenylalanyl-tRNA--protein transferase